MNLLPVPGDILTGMYFPWLDYKWGHVVGVPVKNPLISDVTSQIFIWKSQAMQLFKDFQFPLWDNKILSGVPLLASYQAGAFYPFNVFYFFLSDAYAFSFVVVSQTVLSLIFMFLYLKQLRLSRLAAIWGSLVFSFSAFAMVWSQWGTVVHAGLYLPLALYFLEKYENSRKVRFLAAVPFLIACSIFAGHPQISIYLIIFTFLYLFGRFFLINGTSWEKVKKEIGNLFFPLLAVFFGLLISSVQLLPSVELYLNSFRESESYISEGNFGILPWRRLIAFVAPDFFGNPTTANYWAEWNYQETAFYLGVVPLVFILIALVRGLGKRGTGRHNFLYLGAFFVLLLFIFDSPLAKLPYLFKFPFLSQSYASRGIYLLTFVAAVLTALGLNSYFKKELDKKELAFLTLLGLVWLAFVWGVKNSWEVLGFLFAGKEGSRLVAWRNLILPTAILGGSIFILWIRKLFVPKKFHFLVYFGLLFLLLFDLYRFSAKYLPFVKKDLVFPETAIISFLQRQEGCFRIMTESDNIFPSNSWAYYGLESASGYNPLYPERYARLISLINTASWSNVSRYGIIRNLNSPLVDLLNVRYLVVLKTDDYGRVSEEGRIAYYLRDSKFVPVHEDKSLAVLENPTVLPRSFLSSAVVEEKDDSSVAELLTSEDFVGSRKIILEENPPSLGSSSLEECDDKVEYRKYTPNHQELLVTSCGNKMLFVSENYYPGWTAYLDNKKVKIYRANYSFRAVAVPAGVHEIRFVFFPASFKIGIALSVLGTALWFLILRYKIRAKDLG